MFIASQEKGQGLVEYAIIPLIAIVVIAVMRLLDQN
jgi:Flp pilus assembly pilin Flp